MRIFPDYRLGIFTPESKGGDPKVKDRLKGYLSFFIMPGKSRRVRVMDFFWGGVEDNTDN